MDESSEFDIRMDVKYGHLQVIDIPRESVEHEPWFNQTLTTVNDAVVRVGLFEGEFPWHKHEAQDEMFLVLEGRLLLDVQGEGEVTLETHQGYTVPRGVEHRPRSPKRSVVLMIERQGVVPTGD